MNIVQLTPGAGAMYCGNCFRDNSLVTALRRLGHRVTMVPLYLPLTLEDEDQSAGTPVFFGGVNVYLEQKSRLFRHAPDWFRHLLSARPLLRWAAGKAAKTRAAELGELTLSMLRGESGYQARELEDLIHWLGKAEPHTDVICLSNALLLGQARRLKSELRTPVVCTLQGEDYFLDALPLSHRAICWQTLAERAAEADAFISPSKYFASVMAERLDLPPSRIRVVLNGIDLAGYHPPPPAAGDSVDDSAHALSATPAAPARKRQSPPVLGFFARMCREKGLDTLMEAFVHLRGREQTKNLRLRVGGSCGPADKPFVNALRQQLQKEGLLEAVEFHPNLERSAKLAFLRGLSVFSVPARYGEAFGLYVLEAMAACVPVAQPKTAAFPEIIDATGGGVLCAPGDPKALADAIADLLQEPERADALGAAGARAVFERFSSQSMAQGCLRVFDEVRSSLAQAKTRETTGPGIGQPAHDLQAH
jgi:glycosyltransferase involved in cell wall biosynthesis